MNTLMSGFYVSANDTIVEFTVANNQERIQFNFNKDSRTLANGLGYPDRVPAFQFDINPEQFEHFKNNVLDKNGNVWFIDEKKIVPGKWTTSQPQPQPDKDKSNVEDYFYSNDEAMIRVLNHWLPHFAKIYGSVKQTPGVDNPYYENLKIKTFQKCLEYIEYLSTSIQKCVGCDARAMLEHYRKQLDEEISNYSKPFLFELDATEEKRKVQKYTIMPSSSMGEPCKQKIINFGDELNKLSIEKNGKTIPVSKSDINFVITEIVMSFRDELETLKHEEEELKKAANEPGLLSMFGFGQTKQATVSSKQFAIDAKKNAINAILKYIEMYRIQLRYIGQINPENAIRYEPMVNDAMETLNANLEQISTLLSTQPQWRDALQGILYFLNEVKKVIEGHQQVILEFKQTELGDISTKPQESQETQEESKEREKRIAASKGIFTGGKRKRTCKKRGRTNKKRKSITRCKSRR